MNTKEFEALKVGDVVKYAKECVNYVVIEKLVDRTYKVQCTRIAATPALWERIRRGDL